MDRALMFVFLEARWSDRPTAKKPQPKPSRVSHRRGHWRADRVVQPDPPNAKETKKAKRGGEDIDKAKAHMRKAKRVASEKPPEVKGRLFKQRRQAKADAGHEAHQQRRKEFHVDTARKYLKQALWRKKTQGVKKPKDWPKSPKKSAPSGGLSITKDQRRGQLSLSARSGGLSHT